MTATVVNHGKAAIKIGSYSGGTFLLGYTRNGADVSTEGFWIDVPGDENAGDSGPPIDIQYVGEMARVRLELTKWDNAVLATVMAKINSGKAAGVVGVAGAFVFLNNYHFRLTIDCPTLPRNFPVAVPRAPTQRNMGVRFAMKVLEFDCYKDEQGVLWNTSVS